MCGLAGIVTAEPLAADELARTVGAMTARLAHRGPDGHGVHARDGVAVGHRRLAVLDLSDAAAQPMLAPDGSALVFNGEIYNFREVRDALGDGPPFRSTGDAEVLLRALGHWGQGALDRVHGMFAFAYWDAPRRELLLARDRFGKKPLYYAPLGGPDGREGLVFASELRALLAHPRVHGERALDPAALAQYLFHEYVPAPRSILANVRKLAAGHQLTWRASRGIASDAYYVPRYHRGTTGTPDELTRAFTEHVTQATRDRLVADVPVGVFLSGGLDSSLIAACAVRAHPRVATFCIGFDEPSFDERAHARAVATHLGTSHTEEVLSLDAMRDALPEALDWLDEPFADSSFLPTSLLARLTRRHVTVALGGDGGDELLAGYPTFLADRAASALVGQPLRRALASVLDRAASHLPSSDRNQSLEFTLHQVAGGLASPPGAERHARWLAPLQPEQLAQLLGPAVDPTHAPESALEAVTRETARAPSAFDAATAFYLRLYLGEGVLTKVDRATMRYSLEARAPLLDTRVVEFCLGLDPRMKVRHGTTKWLMRRALAPLVPPAIIDRTKKGFGAPLGAWLRGPLLPMLRDTLAPARLREAGWVRPEPVATMIEEHATGRRDWRKPLYALLVLEHWRRRWFQ